MASGLCLGRLYEETGRLELAEQQYRSATLLDRISTTPWVYLGHLLVLCGRYGEAKSALLEGLGKEGDTDEVLLNLGHCCRALREYPEALRYYKEVVEIDAACSEARKAAEDIEALLGMISGGNGGGEEEGERKGNRN